jgi:hypothetical protein
MQTRTFLPLLASAVVALPLGAQSAAPEFSWRGTLAAGKTVEIRGVNGRIDAEPATGNTIEVTAEKREGREGDMDDVKVEMVETADGVTFCAVYPTPRRSRRENHCGAGDDYQMNTQDNDVEVRFRVKLPRNIRLDASMVNGGIRAEGLSADAALTTVNGSIDVVTSGIVEATTVNGSIEAEIGRTDWTGELEFSSVNGRIVLTAPASLSADIEAKTVNGGIDSDFPITVQGRVQRHHLRGRIGEGGRSLEMSTVNGGIELRRRG